VAKDTETTGTSRSDRIVEIALIVFKGDQVIEEWSTLINPMRDVGDTSKHGISASMVVMAPLFSAVTSKILEMLNGRFMVGHNLVFDQRMLHQELERIDVEGSLGSEYCTMIAARKELPLLEPLQFHLLRSKVKESTYFPAHALSLHSKLRIL
jgi:DNA polymerase-3 subunit epsilon